MKTRLFKIKEGKLDQWKQWCFELETTRRAEALKTLLEEGLSREGFYIFEIQKQFYTFAYTVGEAKPANLDKEINQKHKQMKKECLEKLVNPEKLYDLHFN